MGFDDDSDESIAERASEAVEQSGCLDCDEIDGLDERDRRRRGGLRVFARVAAFAYRFIIVWFASTVIISVGQMLIERLR